MKKIVQVIIALNSLILGARSMDDPPPHESRATANFSLSILAFMETFSHQENGILVNKLNQEESDEAFSPEASPLPYNPQIPDELNELSNELNTKTLKIFTEYLSKSLPTDHFFIQVAEQRLQNPLIEIINSSPAQFIILITTDETTNLRRFSQIAKKLNPRINVALSDRTVKGIDQADIERLLTKAMYFKLYYLALHHLNDETADKIATCGNIRNLVGLSLERSHLTGNSVLHLAESRDFPCLKVFSADLKILRLTTQDDFTERLAPFQKRLHRYEWIGY